MRTIRFHSEAEIEFREAVLWYENQHHGLGLEFLRCIDDAVQKIKRSPDAYPKVYKHLRRIVVKRFPFIIIYDHNDTEIFVIAVFHSKRNPNKLIKRN